MFIIPGIGRVNRLPFHFLSEVKTDGTQIRFKKIFRPEKVYTFDKIGYPSSFRYKRLLFTSVIMKNSDGTREKYLILNNNAWLSGENINAEEILLRLKKQ